MNISMENIETFYPLSPMQQGMMFHSLLAPESGVYVEQLSCRLRGELSIPAFQQAWQHATDRHPILRTAFVGEALKEPVQVVHRHADVPIEHDDWRTLPDKEQEARLAALLADERRRGFVLAQPPLMRLRLVQVADDSHIFTWTYHHLLLDGWSVPILLQEVFALYEAFRLGRDLRLPPTRPYRDYIVWLRRQDAAKAEEFWKRYLGGFTAPTPLVVDRPITNETETRYAEETITLPATTMGAIQTLARQIHVTMNTMVQGAWGLLLSRYSGEDDVVFGATVSGRPPDLPGAESMIGLFINTLPVRVKVASDMPVSLWLQNLQAEQAELRQYEYSPLVHVQGWSNVPRGMPLFNSLLVYENYPIAQSLPQQEGSLEISDIRSAEMTNYPLTVVSGPGRELLLSIHYDVQRFDAATVWRMVRHLGTLLTGITDNPQQRLSELPLLTADERRQILVEWNETSVEFPRDRCVHELFEEQVERTPNATAVTFADRALTYRELNQRANQLAHYLRKLGVGPEILVGICVERSLDMIVALLGVFKAGGAYLPLDPSYPADRLAFMLDDAGVGVLLTHAHLLPNLPEHHSQIVCLDSQWDMIAQESQEAVERTARADNLAYVIYTSGSTGRPKGALVEHRGLTNLIIALLEIFGFRASSRVLQFFSFGFDASLAEILPTLVAGGTLYIAYNDAVMPGPAMIRFLQDNSITMVAIAPSILTLLPQAELPALETLIVGGEACSRELAQRWSQRVHFINAYGPTETTVAATHYPVHAVPDLPIVPIGRPIQNTRLYILDAHRQPVPIGVPGELYIGGVGVARGYLNRPDLTTEKFIPDPFGKPGERLYRSGDLVRYLPDGNIEFLGRIDNQVKIRGFRIELGEIEAVLRQEPDVREAVVLAREDTPGDKRLVAYIVPQEGKALNISDIRAGLRARLPEYMLPSAFVLLETLPLTPNGKVDRRALPAPEQTRSMIERVFLAARDELELQLIQIWEDILGIHPISISDDFFELGGHSLLAVRVVAQIQQRLGKTVSLASLWQGPTVESLAAVLRGTPPDGSHPLASLVALNPKGTKKPLFFVHPSGGSVHWYIELAQSLGHDQPFYGLQAKGLNGDQAIHTTIEDMAEHYVAALRTVQPEGPYALGSWSMGVMIAYEMAQQLQRQGQEVSFLALLDQGPVLPFAKPEDDAAYLVETYGKNIQLSLEHLRTLAYDDQVAHVYHQARSVEWLLPEVTLEQFRHFVRLLRTHTEAWRAYSAQPYPGRVTLFRAAQQSEHSPHEPDMGWASLALGGVDICDVPGDHLSMMHEPNVRVLAQALATRLDRMAIHSQG